MDAATELFGRDGYEQVSMADIAASVAVGPSALYRHFPGKQQLLVAVINRELSSTEALLQPMSSGELRDALPAMAGVALEQSHFPVLWQREARRLPPAQYDELLERVRAIGQRLAVLVGSELPETSAPARDLLAWAMLAVLMSASPHRTRVPRPEMDQLLARLAERALDASVRAEPGSVSDRNPRGLPPRTRREALLREAIRLFAQRGYASVGIEDIAASLDIAGQSVYNHFPSKHAMLETALTRGGAHLQLQVSRALAEASDASDALRRLSRSYVEFAVHHSDLVELLANGSLDLPDAEHDASVAAQRDHVEDWNYLLREARPDLDAARGRITVHAAIGLVNDVVRTPHLRAQKTIERDLESLCQRVLGVNTP